MKSTSRFILGMIFITIATGFAEAQEDKTASRSGAGSVEGSASSATASAISSASGSTSSRKGGNESDPATADPLVRVLLSRGLLTPEEAKAIGLSGSPVEQRDRLAALLRDKGLISTTEYEGVRSVASDSLASASVTITPALEVTNETAKSSNPSQTPATPTKIAAVAPVRLLGIDTPKREGLIPDIKLGTGARLKLYGIFKTSIIHDSSSPQGNDFPLPLLAGDTGPENSPEFHLRARGLRLGANFEWLDPAPNLVITGKIEFDFEGNFTRANNRNISSIRSSQPSIRLAWVRIDRRFNDKTSAFALFGQDWSPFVSSTLPNMIENTNFGGLGYGAAYTRIPQARFGFNFKAGGSRSLQFGPEIAIVVPAFGDLPANVADQLGFGERQGTDSQQPGVQGRAVLQWQLDKAENVVPAQLIVSFEHAKRTAIVTLASVPAAFRTAFPSGAEVSSNSNGYSAEFQLPTHFMTAVGKYYAGSDLRFYFAGQLLSNFNDTAGLISTATASSIDAASTVVFGFLNGAPVVAPQRPVRGQGGFVQLGFPLSRIFDADPKGRNPGWTAYLYYGYDQAIGRDARRFGARGSRSDLFSGNIQYKLNQWITFAYEQGYYRTRAANRAGLTLLPLFRGIPSFTTHDIRSEFAAIFSF
jgi:hypothetical protein